MKIEYLLPTANTTRDLGQAIAQHFVSNPGVIFLRGDMGMGKTTFAQGFITALTQASSIESPTYSYMKTYLGSLPIHHFDLYRIDSPEQIYELGLLEKIHDEKSIRLIEWPECGELSLEPDVDILLCQNGQKRMAIITTELNIIGMVDNPKFEC